MSLGLAQLHAQLEAAGYLPGTPAYAREERKYKVELCKGAKEVGSCWECGYFDHCELIKAHLRDMYAAS
jgi:hypothetical protein